VVESACGACTDARQRQCQGSGAAAALQHGEMRADVPTAAADGVRRALRTERTPILQHPVHDARLHSARGGAVGRLLLLAGQGLRACTNRALAARAGRCSAVPRKLGERRQRARVLASLPRRPRLQTRHISTTARPHDQRAGALPQLPSFNWLRALRPGAASATEVVRRDAHGRELPEAAARKALQPKHGVLARELLATECSAGHHVPGVPHGASERNGER